MIKGSLGTFVRMVDDQKFIKLDRPLRLIELERANKRRKIDLMKTKMFPSNGLVLLPDIDLWFLNNECEAIAYDLQKIDNQNADKYISSNKVHVHNKWNGIALVRTGAVDYGTFIMYNPETFETLKEGAQKFAFGKYEKHPQFRGVINYTVTHVFQDTFDINGVEYKYWKNINKNQNDNDK